MKNKILFAISGFLGIISVAGVNAQNETGGTAQAGMEMGWGIIAVVVLLALLPVLRGLILAKRKRQKSLVGIKEEIKRLVEGLKAAGAKDSAILGSVKKFAPKAKDLGEFLKIIEKKDDEGWLTAVRNKLSSLFSSRKMAIRTAAIVQKATAPINPKLANNASALLEKTYMQNAMIHMLEREGMRQETGDIKKIIKDATSAIKAGDLKTAGFLINSAAEMLQKLKNK